MSEDRHIIWSNYDLDYEDWRADLEAEYPELSEDERIALMYELNNDYLDDERLNLSIQLPQPILMIADIGPGMAGTPAMARSRAARSATASIPIWTMPHGMLTSWVICGATPFTTMAPTTTSTGCISPVFGNPRSSY